MMTVWRFVLSKQSSLFFDDRSPKVVRSHRARIITEVSARAATEGYDYVEIFTADERLVAEGAIGEVREVRKA